jgi:hypothetical protein
MKQTKLIPAEIRKTKQKQRKPKLRHKHKLKNKNKKYDSLFHFFLISNVPTHHAFIIIQNIK